MTRPALSSRATWAVLAGLAILGGVFRLAGLAQVPPGQFLDESLVSIIARDLAAAGKFPVYIGHGGGGYYPAIIYLTRLARWLSGGHPLAARGGVALLSALSLPLIFLALRAIFALDEPRPRAAGLALLAAGVVAVSVPDAIISRGGAEMTLTTPLAALTYLGLAAGLRASKRWMFAAAGAALGLSLYTYYSARLLPLGVAGALLWIAWAERPAARGPLAGLLLTAGAALAAALPLGAYFWQHPDIFFARALTTSQALRTGQTGLPAALAISTLHTLAGLVWPGAGDALARHNLPGRAFFDAFTALLFVVGLLAALRRRRRGSILLLNWAAALLLPTILTYDGVSPTFPRLIAGTPAMAGLAALGGLSLVEYFDQRARKLGTWVLALGLAFSLGASAYAFFGQWARLPGLYEAYMVQDWTAAHWALAQSRSATVYVSPELISDPFHASFDLLLRGGPVRDFPGGGCLLYRDRPDRPLTYLAFVPRDKTTTAQVAALFPAVQSLPPILAQPDDHLEYTRQLVPAGAAAAPPAFAVDAVFGEALRLVGFDLDPAQARRGEPLPITLRWQALAAPLPELVMFVHLYPPGPESTAQQPAAQHDGAPCGQAWPTTRLQPGEIVVDPRALTIPADYADPSAILAVGVYEWPSLARLPVSGQAAQLPANRVLLGEFAVAP